MNKKDTLLFKDEQRISETISFIRYPLILLVLFIHLSPQVHTLSNESFPILSDRGILNCFAILFSHVLGELAVPLFYCISGYLFFIGVKEWNWNIYKRKIYRRATTLLLPYIMWNLTACLMAGQSPVNWHIYYDFHIWGLDTVNILGQSIPQSGPCNYPLWYLRDLIAVSICSPIIYFALRKEAIITLILLFICYETRVWLPVACLSVKAFLFFSMGAYISLYKVNILSKLDSYKYIVLLLGISMIIFEVSTWGLSVNVYTYLIPLLIIVGVISTFYIASLVLSRTGNCFPKFLASNTFFIYAFHEFNLPIIGSPLCIAQNIFRFLIPGTSWTEEIICYLISPILASAICVFVCFVLKKYLPFVSKLYTGK